MATTTDNSDTASILSFSPSVIVKLPSKSCATCGVDKVQAVPVVVRSDVPVSMERHVMEVRARVGPWMAFKMLFKGYVRPTAQLKAKHALETYDNPDYDEPADHFTDVVSGCPNQGEEAITPKRKPRRDNTSWWTVYSLLAHAEFNRPSFTRANEMVVSTWIRKQMAADGVTRVDCAKVLGAATRMAFVPTESDIFAAQMAQTPAFRKREGEANTRWWTAWWDCRPRGYESSQ
uniref:Uncharacterized protein n=1 Tax=Plasmopara viticola lesion associated tombus-like virus 1 TaxID=2770118 RepID=A0A866UDG1_9TOMB|nr:hypothetical protein [Plasmopara viticola lesion associated tombus-like virus 1]